ncbi:hypothetical protein [Pleomorphovibrio marinus]|uniref:hypothetical protein n=1 Tax=Pleomorphovibrio marinus TaxID=2164132 RepID=UPI000E0B93C2|nr:hypothetical protein [Pleomorphovibrio marinus]
MKLNLDAIDEVYQRLNVPEVTGVITGRLTKNNRPFNSDKEDIVISDLALNNDQLQRGMLVVNIHVPNLVLAGPSGTDTTQANHARLKALSKIIVPLLKDYWGLDYNMDIEQINLLTEEKSSFQNIRVEYFAINV